MSTSTTYVTVPASSSTAASDLSSFGKQIAASGSSFVDSMTGAVMPTSTKTVVVTGARMWSPLLIWLLLSLIIGVILFFTHPGIVTTHERFPERIMINWWGLIFWSLLFGALALGLLALLGRMMMR